MIEDGSTWLLLGALAVTAIGVVFVGYLAIEGSATGAAEKTSRRAGGVVVGAGTAATAAATVGTEAVLQLPELVITLVGIGAIVTDVSWPMFAAVALVAYVIAEVANGGPRSA